MSGGEKKKVAFASIMVTNPDVYILDEPFNNLSKEYEEFLGNFYMTFIQLENYYHVCSPLQAPSS
ncbi:MAG: ATP-binding cassette domain-containing protein [Streptococcus sp.]